MIFYQNLNPIQFKVKVSSKLGWFVIWSWITLFVFPHLLRILAINNYMLNDLHRYIRIYHQNFGIFFILFEIIHFIYLVFNFNLKNVIIYIIIFCINSVITFFILYPPVPTHF